MRRILTVATSLLLLATASAQAAPALKSIWGPLTLPDGRSAGPTYKALGVDDMQLTFSWQAAEPGKPANPRDPAAPAYVWDPAVDAAIAEARRYGFDVALMVKGTPGWANGGKDETWAPTR